MINPTKVGTRGQINATRALLKFCREHGHAPYWIKCLEECLIALEDRNSEAVRDIRERFARAGMGSYLDWFPDVIFPHEDADYVEAVWYGLDGYWREMMRPFESIRQ